MVWLTIKNRRPKCVKELLDGVLFCRWPVSPLAVTEFVEDNFWVYPFPSVGDFKFKNPWKKVLKIRFATPNEQCISGVLLQVFGA